MEPLWTTAFIIAMDVLVAALMVILLRLGGASGKVLVTVSAGLVAWLGVLVGLIPSASLFPADLGGVSFFSGLLLGVALVTALMFTPAIRKPLLALPFELMMMPQGLRAFLGAGFLVEGVIGVLPASFGIADGITHITAAFLALMTALVYGMGYDYRSGAWFANLFGLLDIVIVAGGIAFFLLPEIGPHHNVMYAALFAAPIFIGLHIISIYRLWTTPSLGRRSLKGFPKKPSFALEA